HTSRPWVAHSFLDPDTSTCSSTFCFTEDRMNNTTCHSIDFDFPGRFLPPVYILVFIIGLVANGWGLKSLLQNWKKLGNVNVFVFNLGLTDVLYLLTLPFIVVYYFMDSTWVFGDTFCKITRFCFNLNLYGSIGFLTCISVYRYLAIVHPMKVMGRLSVTHSVVISVLVWLLVSVQSLPDMFYTKTSINMTKCYDTTSDVYVEDYLKYYLGWTLTGFCIPLLITLGCYGHVIVTLCRKENIDKVLKQKSLMLLVILVVLFSVCYIPYHILKNLNLWSRVLQQRRTCLGWYDTVYIARQISRGLVSLNSALNPLVYLHGSEVAPAQLRKLFQQARQAVMRQASTPTQMSLMQM
uniref:Si:dkey-78k11.9 n=2 Tax=Sphaeramia orbicularis TaxID=375764 RepID=A0A673AV90_9TELE